MQSARAEGPIDSAGLQPLSSCELFPWADGPGFRWTGPLALPLRRLRRVSPSLASEWPIEIPRADQLPSNEFSSWIQIRTACTSVADHCLRPADDSEPPCSKLALPQNDKLMRPWLAPALVAVPLFAVTNADDLVLLTVFFSNPRTRASSIVLGQLLGIGVLTALSIFAARLAVQLPDTWLPFLGLAPIALGVRHFFSRDEEEGGKLPPAMTWWTVASITVANGGDNLAVYIPVFAVQSNLGIIVIAVMFGLLTLAWCGIATQVVRHPRWGLRVQAMANASAPYVLIALGLWVLAQHPAVLALARG